MSLYASIGYGLVGLWILAQCAINLYVLATNQREGQCADTIDLPLNLFESSTGAIRSNNVPSALSSALTSLVPFIVLYLAPIYEILRHGTKHRIQGVTADGVFFWLTAAVNVLAKNAWQQPRPEAYRLCIRDKLSYGQPSGHAMWAVGIWTTCVVLFLSTRATKPKDETAVAVPFHSWVYDTLALPPNCPWKKHTVDNAALGIVAFQCTIRALRPPVPFHRANRVGHGAWCCVWRRLWHVDFKGASRRVDAHGRVWSLVG